MEKAWEEDIVNLVRKVVAKELPPGAALPEFETDLIKSGDIDSMGWVGILSGLENSMGVRNIAAPWPQDRPQSMASLVEAVGEAVAKGREVPEPSGRQSKAAANARKISIAGWGCALGSVQLEAAQIEKEFGLPPGTIRDRAGIRSVCRVGEDENELSMAQKAASSALETAQLEAADLDLLVCTSTTCLELPSLGAALHSRLLLEGACVVMDVGGACVGLVNALAAAKALMAEGGRRAALVVASEVHSRRFASSNVPGEFRGLFGDGACAFILQAGEGSRYEGAGLRLGEFVSGCSGSMASSLRAAVQPGGVLEVVFSGEALAKGAVAALREVIGKLEELSGVARAEVECFACHEPNPRLAAILAQTVGVPLERFTQTAETSGNLGAATCGANLCTALTRIRKTRQEDGRHVIFLAAVGPGVLSGGTYIVSEE